MATQDIQMADATPGMQDLNEWISNTSVVAASLTSLSRGEHLEANLIALRAFIDRSPVPVDSKRLKDGLDLKALWQRVQGEAFPHASFLLELWGHARERSSEEEEYARFLHEAFTGEYKGDSVDLFCKAMPKYAATFDSSRYYGRIIAWHGPSGAGKSKGVDALQALHPTYTVCFRESSDPKHGWPLGDEPVFTYFAQTATNRNVSAEERVAAFLGAFFEVASIEVDESQREKWKFLLVAGEPYEDSTRGALFMRVAARARQLLERCMQIDTVRTKSHNIEPQARYRKLWDDYCEQPALELVANLPTSEYVFFAFDECTDIPGVEPIQLRRILEAGNHVTKLWFVLLGTNAKIQSLQPTAAHIKPSIRFSTLSSLPAWCHFGFGQLALAAPTTPVGALSLDYLRTLGRPLFAKYTSVASAYALAFKKLFSPQEKFRPGSVLHVLTAFSHRILLELGSTEIANQMAADSVNSNLRYATRIDGETVRTVCPSEPLLSLLAGDVLNEDNNWSIGLKTLVEAVQRDTIDRGQEGELYCRLLLMRARDFALHNKGISPGAENTFSQTAFQCNTISLADLLDALLYLPKDTAEKIRIDTESYHVNVTHFVHLEDSITAVPQAYLQQLFSRGAAVQCCHNQPVIDGFFVAYGGELHEAWEADKFMIICWQSKARASAASQDLVSSLTGPMQIDAAGKFSKTAQLVILMDLNTKTAFKGGNASPVQITYRKASVPVYAEATKQKPWGGYAAMDDQEPKTWCLNIRGHGRESYRCTGPMKHEGSGPDFSALFEQVEPDISANKIIAEGYESSQNSLHPLGCF